MKPYHEMSEPEKLEYGREVATDPTCRDMRIGPEHRLLTNCEMAAATLYQMVERRKAEQFLKDEL